MRCLLRSKFAFAFACANFAASYESVRVCAWRLRFGCRIMVFAMNGLTYIRKTTSPTATKQLAATLSPYLKPGDVVVLKGDLGAGKTQFVQGVAAGLGVRDQVISPTFNILLAYEGGSLPLYHFDLYRLERARDLEDIGYFETIDGDGVSFIEWGDKFPEALPYSYLEVILESADQGARAVRAHAYGERSRQLLFLWAKDSKSRLMKA